MREILPRKLWLGNAADLRNAEPILQKGIQAVINVAIEQWTPSLPRTLIVCHFPILDGEQDVPSPLSAALSTLATFLLRLRAA